MSVDRGLSIFAAGFNCAQAVLGAHAEQLGLPSAQAMRLATPFGAGLARRGRVCGCVTGALMVIGLRAGRERPEDEAARDRAYALAQAFLDEFAARHGSLACRDLLGVDLGRPGGLEEAKAQELFSTRCPAYVRSALELLG